MEWFKETFKDILPLESFHITDLPKDSCNEILAILLSLTPKTFNLFWQSQTLKNICKEYLYNTTYFKTIQQAQYQILLTLQNQKDSQKLQEILQNLDFMRHHNLLEESHYNNLKSFLTSRFKSHPNHPTTHLEKTPQLPKNLLENFFDESLKILTKELNSLSSIAPKNIFENLQNLITKAQSQHFSIGITGILSSGKSTLLNALLGQEILGSSTIPETASLTILKYSPKSYAKIIFWNQEQWQELKSTLDSKLLENLLENQEFSDFFKNYIQESEQSLEIPLQDLPKFTSANNPSKLCNLVQKTILFTPLNFLKNKVEIVDTPGLDDPIIQREEITKNYLTKCDLLIHAMNASQSATQIDLEFLLETLQTSNISRLLIILTHADLLTQEELHQALNYTKESIQAKFQQNLPPSQAKLFLERLDFIHIASYPALLCQNNPKQAKELGYTLESSNFNTFLEYLQKTLLGNNSTKAKDIIYLTAQGFHKNIEILKEYLDLELKLLFSTQEEIAMLIQKNKQEINEANKEFETLKFNLQNTQTHFQEYLKSTKNTLTQKLNEAQNILIQRIFEDILYDYQKHSSPSKERIERILTQGLEDFLIDILRTYRQNLAQKISQLQNTLLPTLKAPQIQLHKSTITKTKIQILNHLNSLSLHSYKNQENKLKEALQQAFQNGFANFENTIYHQSQEIASAFLNDLKSSFEEIMQQSSQNLETKKQILQKSLDKSNSTQKQQKESQIMHSISSLKEIQILLQELQEYATRNNDA